MGTVQHKPRSYTNSTHHCADGCCQPEPCTCQEAASRSIREALVSTDSVVLMVGDHLVGWANSSIRHPDELPVIDPQTKLRGVIREDPLQAALHPQHADAFLRHQAATATDKLQAKAAPSQTDFAAAPDNAQQHKTSTAAAHSQTRLAAADEDDAHARAGIDMSTAGRTSDQGTMIEFSTSKPNDSKLQCKGHNSLLCIAHTNRNPHV